MVYNKTEKTLSDFQNLEQFEQVNLHVSCTQMVGTMELVPCHETCAI